MSCNRRKAHPSADLSENRSENVTITDVRLDKAFSVRNGRRLILLLGVYKPGTWFISCPGIWRGASYSAQVSLPP